MLKITPVPGSPEEPSFRLEGRLVGPWVKELRDAVSETVRSQSEFRLDLSGVQFIDPPGLKLLHALQQHGAVLEHVSPFIAELLRTSQS